MRLIRLYTNKPAIFPPIQFRTGLNVVLAEIRLPENQNRDTHNLGKTTLAALIDFCLLKKRHRDFFLFKHSEMFQDFVFFLELEVGSAQDRRLVAIRRTVAAASKLSFLLDRDAGGHAAALEPQDWTHWEVAFDKAKLLLDGILDLRATQPWDFRKAIAYALRLQNDYADVFQLERFRGTHADWKPFLAHLLGLDGQLVTQSYELAAKVEEQKGVIASIEPHLAGIADTPDVLEGLILLRQQEVESLERQLSKFDFRVPELAIDTDLVERVEVAIAELNESRYHLELTRSRLTATIDDAVKFDLDAVEAVYKEAGIYFAEQVRVDYEALLRFLAAISSEREEYLRAQLAEANSQLERIGVELDELNQERMQALEMLRSAETFEKYRRQSERLVTFKTALGILERQRSAMMALLEARRRLAELIRARQLVVDEVTKNVHQASNQAGKYRTIRLDFSRFIRAVLDRDAVLSTSVNREGNIEFDAELLDQGGMATSADRGHSYKKLLCVAFDASVFSAYLQTKFVHFVYHDGVFESLDDRKKLRLLDELRARCALGLQVIITLIDSDLPNSSVGDRYSFPAEEVIRLLHDEGSDGRLFRMQEW